MTRLTARLIGLAVLVALVLGVVTLGPAACSKIRSLRAQNRVTQGQLTAAGESGADAVTTTGNVSAAERSPEDLTRTNEKEIRNAPGANDAVNPAVRDAGLRSLCRRSAYRDSERCRLLEAPAP